MFDLKYSNAYNLGLVSPNFYLNTYNPTLFTLPPPLKPESDLDWLRRRVKEICWVLPKAA